MKKKNNKIKTKVDNNVSTSDEASKLIKITIIIILVFAVFLIITKLATNKIDDLTKKEPEEVEIQYDEIILGNLLEQSDTEYYVLITFEEDVYNPLYESYFREYSQKENALPKYKVNINNVFNQKHISTDENFDVKTLKFNETTLLKIKYKEITGIYNGRENILEHLKKIID